MVAFLREFLYDFTGTTDVQCGMLQRTVFINKPGMVQRKEMLQRTVFINKIRMLQRTNLLFFSFISATVSVSLDDILPFIISGTDIPVVF
jgi:hypothetical protein